MSTDDLNTLIGKAILDAAPGMHDSDIAHLAKAATAALASRLDTLEAVARAESTDDPAEHGYLKALKDVRLTAEATGSVNDARAGEDEETAHLRATIDDLRRLVADLADPDPCAPDHHGYCQTHAWMSADPPCPHGRARRLVQEDQNG